jgi:hypothetical protein
MKIKAIKIDVETKSVYPIEITDNFRDIYTAIGNGCSLFCLPVKYDNGDGMFADDEILLRPDDIKGGFIFPDWSYAITNNAVIVGSDSEGDSVDCKSTIEDFKDIRFVDIY